MSPIAATSPGSGRADLQGSLTDLPLADLLGLLARTGATGAILLEDPGHGTLWVREGRLAYGRSPGSPTPADLLVSAGIVDRASYDGAVTATSDHQSLTENLVDLFGADRAAIEGVAREQVLTTVFEHLVVGASRFAFHAGMGDPLGGAVSLPHEEVLAEATRRRDQWRRIAELIPSTQIVVGLSRELPGRKPGITITADEWQVMALLDGYRTVADVIAELGQSAFEVCGVLYELLRAGTVVVFGESNDAEADDDVIHVG